MLLLLLLLLLVLRLTCPLVLAHVQLAAREGKERLFSATVGKKGAGDASEVAVLVEKKSTQEATMLPRLTSLAEAAEAAMAFIVDRHRLLHAALHRDVRRARDEPRNPGILPLTQPGPLWILPAHR